MNKPKYTLEVRYTRDLEDEHIPIVGNVMVSGDDVYDSEIERQTKQRLDNGELHAWCVAHVYAQLVFNTPGDAYGGDGDAYIGGCSYDSERDLWTNLNDDLEADALNGAAEDMRRQVSDTTELRAFERLFRGLKRSEELRWLAQRQQRAMRVIESTPHSEWAQHELVQIDEALEKLR